MAYSTVATIRTMEVKMRDSIFSRTQLVNSLNKDHLDLEQDCKIYTVWQANIDRATTATKRRILALWSFGS